MCDTLGSVSKGHILFGKNSDRSPNEPQVLEFIPAKINSEAELNATYISVPQVKETHAVLLSRPTWMWGAEIGVNDCGVCIGNEAVFTLGRYGKSGLTGMDMLRLALERSDSARSALGTVIELLQSCGQGGNCGYDHDFYYDNSFLIMDKGELYVLETCGKEWVYKSYERASISNRLSIGADGDEYSSGRAYDFCRRHTERIYTAGSGSALRRKQTQGCVARVESAADIMSALRTHEPRAVNPFAKGSVASACMHFGGVVGDHTTASLVADLKEDKTIVWVTGSSTPCVSLFKPWLFGAKPTAPVFDENDVSAKRYWYAQERFRRELIGKVVPQEFFAERDSIEAAWLKRADEVSAADFEALSAECAAEEKRFYDKWSAYSFEKASTSAGFGKRWAQKTEVLLSEEAQSD